MDRYQKWPKQNYPKKCPVHNCYVFHPSNSPNYRQNQPLYMNQQKPQIIQIKNLNNNLNNRHYNSYTQYDQSDPSSLLRKYQSPDGVLRGYNNNYSFYVSGSSKIKSNVTINNQINNYTTQTMGPYPYPNRQVKTNNNNSSYLILEKEPIIYNYNTNNFNGFKYNELQNKNIYTQQRVYQAPKIEKRTVKRIVDKEPLDQKNGQYIQEPKDNFRNINTIKQKEMFQKININNNNYQKYIGNRIINRRNISPTIQRPNIISSNYSRPIISQRQGQVQNNQPLLQKKSNNSISYEQRPYQYRVYTEQNDFQTYGNYPFNNYKNYPKSNYPIQNRQKEYASRTQLPDQRDYNYEYQQEDYEEGEDNEDEDDIYEVPVQYNNNYNKSNNNQKEFYSERPFMRINSDGTGKKYGIYTQTLAMNKNYYNTGYEYEPNDKRYLNENNNNYYSQPKYKQEQYGKRYEKQGKEFTPFEKSLRNIRLNNEEIELENGERKNNRVKIKTSGANNHRLYISNNNDKNLSRKNYRTYTEQNAYRNQDYILQDLNEEDYEYMKKYKYDNIQKVQKNNYNYTNEEEIENGDESEDNTGEKMYDNNQLTRAKEGNFIIIQKKDNKNKEANNKIQTEEDNDIFNEEEMPHDVDEIPKKKKVKNIETEINEKYYDNQGNYLGEKKIITTKQVPIEQDNINTPQEEENGEEEQEEIEEYEEENANYIDNKNDEYIPYKSNNKKFQKRGEKNNYNYKKPERPSKYHSYFGDSSNNVYYESKGDTKESNQDNQDRKKLNINTKNINNENIQIRNSNLGIQSENLCVPADYGDNEEKESANDNNNDDNDEKEADEQQIEENEIFDEDEEHNKEKKNEIKEGENEDNYDNNQKEQNYEEQNIEMNYETENNNDINKEQNGIDEENGKKEELNNLENVNEEGIQNNENNLIKNEDKIEDLNENNEKEIQYENEQQINIDKNVNNNNLNNDINNNEYQNFDENENEEGENQNLENGNGDREFVEEEYNEDEGDVIEMEFENDDNNYENNNEQEYDDVEEGLEGGENGNYENYEIEKENIEYQEDNNGIQNEN